MLAEGAGSTPAACSSQGDSRVCRARPSRGSQLMQDPRDAEGTLLPLPSAACCKHRPLGPRNKSAAGGSGVRQGFPGARGPRDATRHQGAFPPPSMASPGGTDTPRRAEPAPQGIPGPGVGFCNRTGDLCKSQLCPGEMPAVVAGRQKQTSSASEMEEKGQKSRSGQTQGREGVCTEQRGAGCTSGRPGAGRR